MFKPSLILIFTIITTSSAQLYAGGRPLFAARRQALVQPVLAARQQILAPQFIAAPIAQPIVRPIAVRQPYLAEEYGPPIPYSFGYSAPTDDGALSSRQEESDGRAVRGSYTIQDAQGLTRTVSKTFANN